MDLKIRCLFSLKLIIDSSLHGSTLHGRTWPSLALKNGLEKTRMDNVFEVKRNQMIALLHTRGVTDKSVIKAMGIVPRHLFVPIQFQPYAYEDCALPIGYDQTISQPFIVAFMTQAAQLKRDYKVLEIGTGSGYQGAILAELCKDVYSIEIVKPLVDRANIILKQLGYNNIHVKHDDGYKGWGEKAPYDVIIITAAARAIPSVLLNQLKRGGRMIMPLEGPDQLQNLIRITKTSTDNDYLYEDLLDVRFVPMVKMPKT